VIIATGLRRRLGMPLATFEPGSLLATSNHPQRFGSSRSKKPVQKAKVISFHAQPPESDRVRLYRDEACKILVCPYSLPKPLLASLLDRVHRRERVFLKAFSHLKHSIKSQTNLKPGTKTDR
jgi:hypothetical protein